MSFVLNSAIVINAITILIFLTAYIFEFHYSVNPKLKAICGLYSTVAMLLYLLSLIITVFYHIYYANAFGMLLLPFIFMPFLIGRVVRYETLKKYTILQILCFIFSFVILLSIYKI